MVKSTQPFSLFSFSKYRRLQDSESRQLQDNFLNIEVFMILFSEYRQLTDSEIRNMARFRKILNITYGSPSYSRGGKRFLLSCVISSLKIVLQGPLPDRWRSLFSQRASQSSSLRVVVVVVDLLLLLLLILLFLFLWLFVKTWRFALPKSFFCRGRI